MRDKKWLLIFMTTVLALLALVVTINLMIDTYGVRSSLFMLQNKELTDDADYPQGLNQHIFNPELILQNPERFDAFLFGSSRVAVIDAASLPDGNFYNMSYSEGLPAEHLAMLRMLLDKGVRVRSVVIGLEEVSFNTSAVLHEDQLLRMIHPAISGRGRAKLFFHYFFRRPENHELSGLTASLRGRSALPRLSFDANGRSLWWIPRDRLIDEVGHPLFVFDPLTHTPKPYLEETVEEGLEAVRGLKDLARAHSFEITFFINPMYAGMYATHADGFLPIKQQLADITDFYDFSGFNEVNNDPLNFFEENHYRYRIGDMVVKRMFGVGNMDVPDDFGVLITRDNVNRHIETEAQALLTFTKRVESSSPHD